MYMYVCVICSNFPLAKGDVVLTSYECSGLEKSLLQCSNAGWKSVTSRNCLDHSHDVGVYCYGKGRTKKLVIEVLFIMILKAACGIHKYAKLLANKQKSISVTH
jgi:hypothetical protein